MRCYFCQLPIESTRNAYRRVTGWEKDRRAGGTNALRVREPSDDWAHAHCVDKAAAGHDPGQTELL